MSSLSFNLYKDDMHASNIRRDPAARSSNFLWQKDIFCLMDTIKTQALQSHSLRLPFCSMLKTEQTKEPQKQKKNKQK